MYYKKLLEFIKIKDLTQKEFAERLGLSANMMSRYLKGDVWMPAEFFMNITKVFPELNLNELFSEEEENLNVMEEPSEGYNYNAINEIEEIEKRLTRLKEEVAKKN